MHEQENVAERFGVAFFAWCLAECENEVTAGCPRLAEIRSRETLGFVEYTENWPEERRLALLRARVTWMWGGQAAINKLTPSERNLIRALADAHVNGYGLRDIALRTERLKDPDAFRIKRAALRRELKQRLVPLLGSVDVIGGTEWKHRTFVANDWAVVTSFDTGGSTRQFEYGHNVFWRDSHILTCSPGSWFALGGPSGTNWNLIHADTNEMPQAINAAANLCSHFVQQLPTMVNAITG